MPPKASQSGGMEQVQEAINNLSKTVSNMTKAMTNAEQHSIIDVKFRKVNRSSDTENLCKGL